MRPRADSLVAFVGSACTYGCPTCPIPDRATDPAVASERIERLLQQSQPLANRLVVLVGGEPFLRRDLPRLLALIRSQGARAGIVTTGRPLLYPQMRGLLQRSEVAYIRVQLFGRGTEHDRAVALPGSYAQTIEAVRSWLAEKPSPSDVDVAVDLRAASAATFVDDLRGLAADIGSTDYNLVVRSPPGELRGPVFASGAALAAWNSDLRLPLLAFESATPGTVSGELLHLPALRTVAFRGAPPPDSCLGGRDDGGSRASAPPTGVRANSFNFIATGSSLATSAEAATCPVATVATSALPQRQLWLEGEDRLELFETDTGDFEPHAIETIKTDLSHLLFDSAPPGVLDDFVDGMRRVIPSPVCETCERRPTCARRYRIATGAPFAAEERWIQAHLALLRGRVLDVGCGEQLYRRIIADLLAQRHISYVGIDPDAPSLSSARQALPNARFVLGDIESYPIEPARYDHILCLRALNHVYDLDEGIGRMAEMLAPGGQLLLVETTPFAMLRRAAQVAAADRAPRAGHQHYRNVTSTDVLPYVRRRSLRIVEHRPISLEGSNQWILLLERSRET